MMDIADFYALKKTMTLKEAAMALAGVFEWNQEANAVCQGMYDAVLRAIKLSEIDAKFPNVRGFIVTNGILSVSKEMEECALISFNDLKEWCISRGVHPKALFPLTSPQPTESHFLHENERKTLLAIIRALAELQGIKPIPSREDGDGWYSATQSLLRKLTLKNIKAPASEKTLAKHLRNAFSDNNF